MSRRLISVFTAVSIGLLTVACEDVPTVSNTADRVATAPTLGSTGLVVQYRSDNSLPTLPRGFDDPFVRIPGGYQVGADASVEVCLTAYTPDYHGIEVYFNFAGLFSDGPVSVPLAGKGNRCWSFGDLTTGYAYAIEITAVTVLPNGRSRGFVRAETPHGYRSLTEEFNATKSWLLAKADSGRAWLIVEPRLPPPPSSARSPARRSSR